MRPSYLRTQVPATKESCGQVTIPLLSNADTMHTSTSDTANQQCIQGASNLLHALARCDAVPDPLKRKFRFTDKLPLPLSRPETSRLSEHTLAAGIVRQGLRHLITCPTMGVRIAFIIRRIAFIVVRIILHRVLR